MKFGLYKLLMVVFFCVIYSQHVRSQTHPVSFVNLLISPESYKGKKIKVFGFYTRTGKMYLTKEHAKAIDLSSSIKINANSLAEVGLLNVCVNKYATVHADFQVTKEGFIFMDNIKKIDCAY